MAEAVLHLEQEQWRRRKQRKQPPQPSSSSTTAADRVTTTTISQQREPPEKMTVELPDQPVIVVQPADPALSKPDGRMRHNPVVTLLTAGYPSQPALLRLPPHFAAAFLRLLIRLLTHETDPDYEQACLARLPTSTGPVSLEDAPDGPDHASQRPHILYNVARLQCDPQWAQAVVNTITPSTVTTTTTTTTTEGTRVPMNRADRPALLIVWNAWERAIRERPSLVPALARLLGLLSVAGVTPFILRRMLAAAPTNNSSNSASSSPASLSPRTRLSMVRAVATAAAGGGADPSRTSVRRPWQTAVVTKVAPRHFFLFTGAPPTGLQRTIAGVSTWPFRHDFGMAVWFRAEHFFSSTTTASSSSSLHLNGDYDQHAPIILLSARTDDGGGIQVSLVPLVQQQKQGSQRNLISGRKHPFSSSSSSLASFSDAACTICVSVFDSGHANRPVRTVQVSGCVLLPRVWYHLAVRHTRSRLKGVFSLSTRQQLSIMLDGKVLLTESMAFPKVTGSDEYGGSDGMSSSTSSLLQSSLRRNSQSRTRINLHFVFGANLVGQAGALYVFNDNVSDASFRALYEATGGSSSTGGGGGVVLNAPHARVRSSSLADTTWDARRSDIVKKSRLLDVNITNDDAEEIVLSQRRPSGVRRKILTEQTAAVVDIGEASDEVVVPQSTSSTLEQMDLPADLMKAAFGSKVYMCWDPRRTVGNSALELHVGAHATMNQVYSWSCNGAQDVIGSIGGIQAVIPLFRSLLVGSGAVGGGTSDSIERGSTRVSSRSEKGAMTTKAHDGDDTDISCVALPLLLMMLKSFVQDHNENARELLRCGGIDVIEQLIYSYRKSFGLKVYREISKRTDLSQFLVQSLLELRAGCAHYVGLETKVFSRLLFNIPLWLGGGGASTGVGLQRVLLPVLSCMSKSNPDKVRDCVGVRDMVHALKEYADEDDVGSAVTATTGVEPRMATANGEDTSVDDASNQSNGLDRSERWQVTEVLLGMILGVLSSGVAPDDLAPFLHFLSFQLESQRDAAVAEEGATMRQYNQKQRLNVNASLVLLFLLQIRPPLPGLFESLAHCCGSVQGGAGWILCAVVNSHDDMIRSIGIRCTVAYLEIVSKSPDAPLALGTSNQGPDLDIAAATNSYSSVGGLGLIAKGLAAMGPGVRSVVIAPSKLNMRVVVKLLWHLLRTHRTSLGPMTYSSLVCWMSDDNGSLLAKMSSVEYLVANLVAKSNTPQPGFLFDASLAKSLLAETGSIPGRSISNAIAMDTVLRLLRFLDGDMQTKLLTDILTLAKASRKSISLLASSTDWQPCLFHLLSESLEQLNNMLLDEVKEIFAEDFLDSREQPPGYPNNGHFNVPLSHHSTEGYDASDMAVVERRLDLTLKLYSALLGHLVREGGDKVSSTGVLC